jgi:type I restriction enzyme M protein
MKKDTYKISDVAKMFDIHEDTLRNWEKEGLITPIRIGKRGDRRYTQEHIDHIVEKKLAKVVRGLDDDKDVDNKMTLSQLKQFLWKSADILRGRVDGSQYKEYIFALLFFKRMSDIWDEEYKKILEEFHDEAIAQADYNHRFNVPKDCRWSVIADQSENIGAKLNEIFDKLTNANSPKLDKIFSKLDFADKDRFPTETMQQLVNHFSKHNFGDQYINSDILGDAYEYLIEQFAAGAGKKGGEFYTPREIERLIMHILDPHEKDHIYDPTVGSGGFLLEAFHYVRYKYNETKARSLYLYGQEFNMSTFTIARINMFLHGLDSADIRMGDTLANPQFLTNENQLQTFDICVSNFPYSVKEWAREKFASNSFGRLDGYEMPPGKNADYAFILHIIKSLNENGKAGIVVPHGTLFKTDASGRIREQILKNDLIEAVIALPAKLFYGVGIPVAVIILNKNKPEERKNKVLIIDAENEYQEGKNQSRLRVKDIEKTSSAFHVFKDIEKFARVVDLAEIEKNDFTLNIRRYVDTSVQEEDINVSSEWNKLQEIEKEAKDIDAKVESFLKELKY